MAILMKQEAITQTEICRIAGNWVSQPGVSRKDRALFHLGEALMCMGNEDAAKIKEAFPGRWEKWDADFDEYGRMLPGEDE